MQWAKAVIFSEQQIIATKGCKPKLEELTPYFKAFESRDETIGRGTLISTQASTCWESTTTSTVTILLWPMVAGATPKTERASAWQWARARRARRSTSS